MNAKKILAVALVALMAVASFAPAFAADKENVMLTAEYYEAINITPDKGDYIEVYDEMICVGPNHIVGGVNWRITKDAVYNRYDIDGYDFEEGAYIGMVTYEFDKAYTVDSFKAYVIDMAPLNIGVENTIDWLPMGFDLLVSTTGEDGTWKVAYSGKNLHGVMDDAGEWQYGEENDESLGHYYLESSFSPVEAKFIRFALTSFNNEGDPTASPARYFNLSELQVFGVAAAGATETEATEPTETEPTETEPTETEPTETEPTETEPTETEPTETEPTETEPTETESPETFDFVIVPVVALAAAAAGAVVLKKKEN